MVRIENSDQTATTAPPADAKGIQFEGFAPHSAQKPGQHGARHGADLHLGNAYAHAAPEANSHCFGPCEKAKNWHPDQNDRGSHAQTWRKQHEEQSQKPMTLGEDGKYQVQPGDEIGEITRRALHAKGVDKPTRAQLTQMQKDILDGSEKDNPTLKCNPGLLHEGTKLTIPGVKSEGASGPATGTATGEARKPESKTPPGTDHGTGTGAQTGTGHPQSEFPSDKSRPAVHLGPDVLNAAKLGHATGPQTEVPNPKGGATVRLGTGTDLLGHDGKGGTDITRSGNSDHVLDIPNLHIELTPKPAPPPQPDAPKPADHWYNWHNLRDRLLDGLEALS